MVIVELPSATPVTVSVLLVLAATPVLLAGVTVATVVALEALANVPSTLTFSVNVAVFPATTVKLVGLNVMVGVALYNGQVNVFVPVELSLHL